MVAALSAAEREFIDLFELDVAEHPEAYKETIVAQPGLWAIRLIAGLDDDEVRAMTRSLKAERSKIAVGGAR